MTRAETHPARTKTNGPVSGRSASKERRRWVTVLLGLVAAGFAMFALIRILGLERGFPLVPLFSYTPYVLPAALVTLVGAALLRRWVSAGALLLTVVALASVLLPRALPGETVAADGPELRLLTLNAHFAHVPPETVVDLVREYDAEVLALQEVTPEMAAGLSEAGLDELLPYTIDHSAPAAAGGTIHSVHPLTELGDVGHDIGSLAMPHAAVEVSGYDTGVEVTSVHPMSPRRPSSMEAWRDGLRGLPEASDEGPVQILAGDFNATLDHAEMRALVDSGYVDAAAHLGDGFTGTWPIGTTPIPPVTIDHVLVDSRATVAGLETTTVEGSSHRALFAEITLPPA